MEVAVSFISSNYDLVTTINKIENTDAEYIHVDIMDGEFVSTKNFSPIDLNLLLSNCRKNLDVHLMCVDPMKYVTALSNLQIKRVTIHAEISNALNIIKNIKDLGIEVGIAINPDTKIKLIKPYMAIIDSVLVMSVVPGAGGQSFIMSTIDKLKDLQNYKNKYGFKIFIDGGINRDTIGLVKNLVDGVISGSFICKSDDFQEKINELR